MLAFSSQAEKTLTPPPHSLTHRTSYHSHSVLTNAFLPREGLGALCPRFYKCFRILHHSNRAHTHARARARARARDAALDAKALLARINRVCLSAATEFVSEKRRVPASPSERTVGQLGGVPAREPARPPPLAHSWIPESGPAG